MAIDPAKRYRACLGRVVPSLARIVARPVGSRQGFTLIEMMIGVALSAVIVLTAVSCFRMVTKAIAAANVLSTENGLLRAGFQVAMLDVDYWHSHADDQAPYNKGFMRQQTQRDNPATDDTVDSTNDAGFVGATDVRVLVHENSLVESGWRRPFQPVRFAPRTDTNERDVNDPARGADYYNAASPTTPDWDEIIHDDHWTDAYNRNDFVPNPNALLASDPRSISRVPVQAMRVPERRVANPYRVKHYGGYRQGYPRLAIGDYALVSASDMRDVANTTARYPANTPPGVAVAQGGTPTTGSVVKQFEYANPLVATVETLPNPVDAPIDNGWGMYQPLMWTGIWQRLNYFGAYQYMTPGTPLLFGDRQGQTPDVNTVPIAPCNYRVNGGTPGTSGAPDQGEYCKYYLDGDYCFNFGECDLAVRMGERFIASPANGGKNARAIEAIPLRPCWPAQGADFISNWYNYNFDHFQYKNPFVVFLGTGDYDAGQGSEYEAQLLEGSQNHFHTVTERGDLTRVDSSSMSTTVWLPYNTTDFERAEPADFPVGTSMAPKTKWYALPRAIDTESKPKQAPGMKTGIMRYGRVAGSQDLTVIRVTIDDPISGKKTELCCMPFGTTFRGARQHWRLYSPALQFQPAGPTLPGHRYAPTPGNGARNDLPIGDFYDTRPTPGPYYVP